MPERIVTTQPSDDEKTVEAALRPQTLAEYVGQARMKDALRICMDAAKQMRSASFMRSEEHTSELQSQSISYAVFCLKKKKKKMHKESLHRREEHKARSQHKSIRH